MHRAGTFIELCKGAVDQLNADYTEGELAPSFITRHTFGISFYDSVVVFERGTIAIKKSIATGNP